MGDVNLSEKQKIIWQYAVFFPLLNVVGIGIGTLLLYMVFDWEYAYAISFFKVAAIALVVIFYLLNFRTLISAIFSKRSHLN